MMFTETRAEADSVVKIFNSVFESTHEGKILENNLYYNLYYNEEGRYFDDFEGLVSIPYGALVYVYRNTEDGSGVYDVYSFGYNGKFAYSKDIEGDLAGLCNAGDDFFPTI